MSTRRCPSCGGLVGADLEWCSQCFTRFDEGEADAAGETGKPTEQPSTDQLSTEARSIEAPPPPEGESASGAASRTGQRPLRVAEEGRILWECPVCEEENDLDTKVCTRCGTAFGSLFEEPEPPPRISPQRAALLSLLVPGAGHVAAGRIADGVARGVIFAFALGMVVALLAAKGVGGPLVPLVVLFVGASATLYMATAVDAYRAVRREPPVVSTRVLLIGATVLLMIAVVVLFIGGSSLA